MMQRLVAIKQSRGGPASCNARVVIFVAGGTVAGWMFRKLATPQTIRADRAERVRNP